MDSLTGIVPPMATPLLNEEKLDVKGIEQLTEHILSGGVHGLFLLGSTGEGPSLSHSLRVEFVKRVCRQVNGRVPVLVGITDTSYKESVCIAEKSAQCGAQAVVLAPPFYFQIDQEELHTYTEQLIEEISLPVYLYDNPALTKVSFGLDIVRDLISRPEVVGFKDSSADMVKFQKLKKMAQEEEISLLVGPEELLMESLVMGGSGGIPGGANIFPDLYVELYNVVAQGDLDRAVKLHEQVMQLSEIVYSGSEYGSGNIINGIKNALKHLDICSDYVALPFKGISRDKAARIEQFVNTMKV